MAIAHSSLLIPRDVSLNLRDSVAVGGADSMGGYQRIQGDAGVWELKLMDIPLPTPEHVRVYRATLARLRNGEEIDIKIFDLNGPFGFYSDDAEGETVGTYEGGATAMTLNISGFETNVGTIFGIGARIYMVTSVVSGESEFFNPISGAGPWDDDIPWSDAAFGPDEVVVNFLPPLRATSTLPTATPLQLGMALRFRGILAEMDDGDVDLQFGRWGHASLTILENIV